MLQAGSRQPMRDDGATMDGQERALDGLLREFARAGTGADQKFVARILEQIRKRHPRYSAKGTPRGGIGWWKIWIILAGGLFSGVISASLQNDRLTTISQREPVNPLQNTDTPMEKTKIAGEILYTGNFSPGLSDWTGFSSIAYDFSTTLANEVNIGSLAAKIQSDKLIRPVLSQINQEKKPGMQIRCEDIEENSIIGVVLNKEFNEDNIEIEFDMRVLKDDDRPKGRWGFYAIGLPRDINGAKPKHHVLFDEQSWYLREIGKKKWVHLRVVMRRTHDQNGVPCTAQEFYCNNKKYFVGRVEMVGNRYSIGQMGVSTEITNFLVRRIEPSTNPSGL
jgi:hypothetical protein